MSAEESTQLAISDEVRTALREGRAVVALESTILSHGLPRPTNLEVGRELEEAVREGGAVPATIAVLDGVPTVGLSDQQLERVAMEEGLRKISQRDLAVAAVAGYSGGTTVASTTFLAAQAGISVFSTGGLGGVHRGWTQAQDESADLGVLATNRICIVAAGVKSILDIPATLERLETLSVTVLGYQVDTFPGFYLRSSGCPLDWRVDSPEEIAAVMEAQERLGVPPSAVLVANALPESAALDPELHDRVLAAALAAAEAEGVRGQALTPFLLQAMLDGTGGASLEANLAAVRGNVALGARIAVAKCARR